MTKLTAKKLIVAFSLTVLLSALVGSYLFVPRSYAQVVEVPGLRAVPLGYQQITTVSSSTALTVPTGATMAIVVPFTQAVRWRDDGTAPTAAIGMPLAAGAVLVYSGNLAAIRFFEQTSGAQLNISYYR